MRQTRDRARLWVGVQAPEVALWGAWMGQRGRQEWQERGVFFFLIVPQ